MVDQVEGGAGAPRGARAPSRRPRITDRRRVRWSATMKDRFLDHLAATCNVKDAAATIGVHQSSVYFLRRRDADFAAAWSEALAMGYEMLETQLVGHALAGGAAAGVAGEGEGGGEGDGDRGSSGDRNGAGDGRAGPIDVPLALRLLTCHRGALNGKATRRGRPPHVATREDTNAAILKKLRVMEAQLRTEADAQGGRPAALAIVDGRSGRLVTGDPDGGA